MKNLIFLILLIGTAFSFDLNSQVLITEIADPADVANNKFVEICNIGSGTIDISNYVIRRYSNGSNSFSSAPVSNASGYDGMLSGGECFVFYGTNAAQDFSSCDSAAASGSINGNGDDVYELYDGSNVLDVYGVVGTDGTGEPWEYENDRVVRNNTVTSGNLGTFDITEWTITASQNTSDFDPCVSQFSSSPTICTAPEFTAIAVCDNTTTAAADPAEFDEYYVQVVVSSLGSATSVDIDLPNDNESNDDDQSGVGMGTYVFGPYNFVDGLGATTVMISDAADATCSSTAEVSEIRCGYTPDNGLDAVSNLNACGIFCDAQGSVSSANVPALIVQAEPSSSSQGVTNNTNYIYVLVANGDIIAVNNSGLFTGLNNGTGYTVHAYNVLESDRPTLQTQFIVGDAIPSTFTGSTCFSYCGVTDTKTPNCFTCPTISALAATSPICIGTETTNLIATISGFDETENGDEDYTVEFVYTTTQATDAAAVYALDASTTTVSLIGTVAVTSAGMTTAAAPMFELPTATTYYVYARILLTDPLNVPESNCRPYAETIIVVNPLPTLTTQTTTLCANATNGTDYDNLDLTSYESAIGIPASLPTTPMTATVSWYQGNGTGGTDITSSASDQDGVSTGDIFTIEYTNENGCVSTTTVTVTVNPLPTLTTQTTTLCANATNGTDYDNLDLTSYESAIGIPASLPTTPMTATVSWYQGNGTGGTDITSSASDQDGVSTGDIFTIEYTNENGCVSTETITITVNPIPTLTAQASTLCSSSSTFNLTTLESNITSEAGTFAYSVGGTEVADPTMYAASNGDIVNVTFTNTSTTCMASTTISITVHPSPTAGTATALSICNADPTQFTVDLFANVDGETAGGTWTADIGNPATTDITDPTKVNFQNLIAGSYSFTYTVTGTSPCVDDSETLVVTVTNCFDLALTKVLTTTGIVKPGDNVTFDIAVINQGAVTAFDVDILDLYNSAELAFVGAIISPNDASSSSGTPIIVMDGFTIDEIAVGATAIVQVTMTIDPNFAGNTIVNNAEIIGGASVDEGSDALDADSTPGSEDGSVADMNDGDIAMTDGSDDYDPATIMICQSNCGMFPWDGTN